MGILLMNGSIKLKKNSLLKMACSYCGYEDPFATPTKEAFSCHFLWHEVHVRFSSDNATLLQRIGLLEKQLALEKKHLKEARRQHEQSQKSVKEKFERKLVLEKQLLKSDIDTLNGRLTAGRNLIVAMREQRSQLMAEIDNLNMVNAQLLIAQITLKERREKKD